MDNLQFNSDEERRKYLADLARLKRIREESRNERMYQTPPRENPYAYEDAPDDGIYSGEVEVTLPELEDISPQQPYYQEYEYREPEEYPDTPGFSEMQEYPEQRRYSERKDVKEVREKRQRPLKTQTVKEKPQKSPRKPQKSPDKPRKNADKNNLSADQNTLRYSPDGYPEDTEPMEEKKKSKWWLWVLIILLVLGIGYVAYHMFFHKTFQEGYYTVAVFGVDSRDGSVGKDALSDVNILVRVDMGTGEIKLASCYRDTYVRINEDDVYHKFNEAHFRGGPEQAVWMIQDNLDIQVDDYATFNWTAVVNAINILGGVDIDITPMEFVYINSYITETVNSTGIGSVQLTAPGLQHLDGVQAVAYARLRLMDTDYNRTERQRKVISLAFQKAKQADLKTLKGLVEVILPQIATSVTLDDMIPFVRNIDHFDITETCGWPYQRAETDIGSRGDCVVPVTLESNVIALHQFFWPDVPYTPSERVLLNSQHIAEVSGCYGDGATEIRLDDLSGQIGNTSGGVVSAPAQQPADGAAVTDPGVSGENPAPAEETTAVQESSAGDTSASEENPMGYVVTTESPDPAAGNAEPQTPENPEESAANAETQPSAEENTPETAESSASSEGPVPEEPEQTQTPDSGINQNASQPAPDAQNTPEPLFELP